MAGKAFHLGWFLQGSSVQAWGEPWTGNIGTEWMVPDFFIEMTRNLERACFDYVLLEDSSYIGESYGGSREIYLHHGLSVPRQDPSVVAALLAQATKHIGIVATFGTFAYPPYLLARLVATLDQVSSGRIGWNAVTGSSDYAARNFGLDGMPPHDTRYDIADEYMEVVRKLWGSWEPGAIVADRERGILVDHTKVHAIDHHGTHFKVRGPLNSGPCVQGQPVIAQAGGSPRGRQFAATHADTIVAMVKGTAGMKAYRDDVRARMAAQGRDPDRCMVLFLVSPVLGDTDEEARAKHRRKLATTEDQIAKRLAHLSKITNLDFGALPLDKPLGSLTTNGHQQSLDEFLKKAGNKTLREAAEIYSDAGSIPLIGTPAQVAEQMGAAMEEIGGDGFLLSTNDTSRRVIAEICDGLVPELQRRGLARRAYSHAMFRDNLLDF
ncbi:NtaA/DmoA family FMN-dependent monooxygenase [Roseomonas sp. PWR1]|uniref:NtaA/DmoA family FMN-dependent monooxygenase n=1 Tax=Roseomonas nitratireducens TaxID=2820810 RepID=A0ABS4ANN9_9PROT|nr:NtaA/DmoA family FMN-dependent monooxygenase [Neoroseomonas nitratireducens]MBP0462983.1 NtaA/DmoA family FMN-dependent monooxygenase [Neoroseomonas nitratireducens]